MRRAHARLNASVRICLKTGGFFRPDLDASLSAGNALNLRGHRGMSI